jgi:glycosyltransferase involved in cell wall biosynthesis
MKIDLLTSWPLQSTAGSGVGQVIRGLSKTFADLGTPVDLVSPVFSPDGYTETTVKRILFNLSAGKTIARKFSPDQKEVVLGFDFDGFLLPRSIPLVSVIGGTLADVVQFESGWIRKVVRMQAMLERKAARKADLVITPSYFAREKVIAHYGIPPSRVRVIPNGIHCKTWTEELDRQPAEKKENVVILTVAKLYKRKGIDLLLHAMKEILNQEPNAELRVVGDGLEMARLRKQAEDLGIRSRIHFMGDVFDFTLLCRHYANCDIFCLPSLHETFGIVFLEAMLAKKPVVAFRNTALPEVVVHGEQGYLTSSGDVGALSAKLLLLIRDPSLRARLSQNSRSHVENHFDWSAIGWRYLELLEGVA